MQSSDASLRLRLCAKLAETLSLVTERFSLMPTIRWHFAECFIHCNAFHQTSPHETDHPIRNRNTYRRDNSCRRTHPRGEDGERSRANRAGLSLAHNLLPASRSFQSASSVPWIPSIQMPPTPSTALPKAARKRRERHFTAQQQSWLCSRHISRCDCRCQPGEYKQLRARRPAFGSHSPRSDQLDRVA